ncbi:MAG: hypothetical protein MZV70_40830 [Desulfobacterales bacterium]|nr:hypothetical protein [Desulfobacterales bacterium]
MKAAPNINAQCRPHRHARGGQEHRRGALAKRLGFAFIDTDIYIQVREGRSLQAIIQAHGADEFCRIEEDHILSLAVDSHVIAPGGSVVYRPKAMAHLKANGVAIHLDIAVERLKRRLDDVDARGVVIGSGADR